MPYVRMTFVHATFVLVTFVHISNIWPNSNQTFWTQFLGGQNYLDHHFVRPKLLGSKIIILGSNIFGPKLFWIRTFSLTQIFLTQKFWPKRQIIYKGIMCKLQLIEDFPNFALPRNNKKIWVAPEICQILIIWSYKHSFNQSIQVDGQTRN